MADAAVKSQRQYCSMGVARERFEHVLHGLQAGADR
jgi:hypothetical protein